MCIRRFSSPPKIYILNINVRIGELSVGLPGDDGDGGEPGGGAAQHAEEEEQGTDTVQTQYSTVQYSTVQYSTDTRHLVIVIRRYNLY